MQTVKAFIEKVKSAGNKDVTLYMYPGEGHGFMNGGKDIHEKMKSKLQAKHAYRDFETARTVAQGMHVFILSCPGMHESDLAAC